MQKSGLDHEFMSIKADISKRYQSLQDIVYKELRDKILDGTLKPGDRLNTNQLSKVLNISRTPIREAINRLTEMGLVDHPDHMEARVADFPLNQVYEYLYIRTHLEGLASKTAAKKFSEKEKKQLNKYLTAMRACVMKGSITSSGDLDEEEFFEIYRDFHTLIISGIKSPSLLSLWEQCFAITARYRKLTENFAETSQLMMDEHQKIVECIVAGNEAGAEAASMAHNRRSMVILERTLAAMGV